MDITHFFTFINNSNEETTQVIQISSTLVQIDKTNFLIDTGFVNQHEIVYVLNKMGLSAFDIHYVLNTHVHLDHVGGNQHFPQAEIYMSERDYFFQRDYMNEFHGADQKLISDIIKSFYPQFTEKQIELYGPLKQQMSLKWQDDLVGNTEQIHYIEEDWPFDFIQAIPTPGHSIGHYAFQIDTPEKSFLVTGESLTTKSAFRLNKIDFPYCHNNHLYLVSQQKIGEFQGIIIPGHDKPFDAVNGKYLEEYNAKHTELED